MKGLTIRQPWASLIAMGQKTIEVRSWPTKYRGPLLITASRNPSGLGPTGCTICLVDLVDCRPMDVDDLPASCLDYFYGGDFAWLLANPKPVANHPVTGRLSLWTPDNATMSKLG